MNPGATLRRAVEAVAENLRFFTRLPLGDFPLSMNFAEIGWAAPLAGACIGAFGAATLFVARNLGLPTLVSATLAVAALVAVGGALHEDGIADVADGFGGGRDREAKLAIMRDSRIGTFGAVALMVTLMLRAGAIASLTRPSPAFGAAAVVLAAAAARAAALSPLVFLPPARSDGSGARAGRLPGRVLIGAVVTLVLIAIVLGALKLEVVRALFACTLAAGSAWLVSRLAKSQIGGQTGDVCGAAATVAEVVTLIALLIGDRGA